MVTRKPAKARKRKAAPVAPEPVHAAPEPVVAAPVAVEPVIEAAPEPEYRDVYDASSGVMKRMRVP